VALQHPVDQAVLERLLGREEAVALHVAPDFLLGPARVLGVDLIEPVTDVEDLARVDLDVGRLAFEAGGGLVDEDAAVG